MPKKIATEEDWIALGFARFSEGGEQALVIERLARSLGTSKTSFYWYFKDRASFLRRIIDDWQERSTSVLIAQSSLDGLSPREAVMTVMEGMFAPNKSRDFLYHLRRLGRSTPYYAEQLIRIETVRLSHMSRLLAATGQSPEAAERKAELLYSYYLGWHERQHGRDQDADDSESAIALIMPYLALDGGEC
ncbi:TetR/AcrR family transcriptional regulator [Paenibacillus sp. 1011MAR3C5]|uniref:TetR/AcrR family transcriptional regulator n=1 Tax=Paenibacillus sp. 1011MAR3C5 TaxID=1675787 RepID=UPI000E6B914A|nr:TetR/AcrR family transcriptional regulator [Paenibacillus sp. 1011MAR3C5]RJE90758.1 TetR/AcrR family transcriptional regulator [Paenibacillus sp. 1011MAR3C5]